MKYESAIDNFEKKKFRMLWKTNFRKNAFQNRNLTVKNPNREFRVLTFYFSKWPNIQVIFRGSIVLWKFRWRFASTEKYICGAAFGAQHQINVIRCKLWNKQQRSCPSIYTLKFPRNDTFNHRCLKDCFWGHGGKKGYKLSTTTVIIAEGGATKTLQ